MDDLMPRLRESEAVDRSDHSSANDANPHGSTSLTPQPACDLRCDPESIKVADAGGDHQQTRCKRRLSAFAR
jgi:hypothetical protein